MPVPTTTAARPGRQERPAGSTAPSVDDPACGVCPHRVDHHDAIALRFCRATLAGALDRGCVCRPG